VQGGFEGNIGERFRLAMTDQRIADLARRVPRLAVRLLSEPSGVHVVCDGVDVAPASLGVALAVDPGRHACIVHAPGHEDGHAEVTLGEGEQKTLEIALGPMVSSGPHQASPGQQDRAPVATGATQRILGLVTGGVGVGAVAVGAVFGFVAKGTYDDAMAACNGTPRPCQGSGVTEGQTAHDQARLATGAFVVGTVLLAGGAVLYLTAPKPKATALAPAVGTREAGVVLRGTW
jgi:hypothetical protein